MDVFIVNGPLAQLAEQFVYTEWVGGSSPSGAISLYKIGDKHLCKISRQFAPTVRNGAVGNDLSFPLNE